jgi:hypothetical protein
VHTTLTTLHHYHTTTLHHYHTTVPAIAMTSSTADAPPNATPLAIETDSTIEMQSFNGHLSGDNTTANARSHHTLTHSHTHDTETEIENPVGKSSIVKNQSHSLKRSILNKFMPMTFSILIFVSGCSVGFLYMSNQFVLDETHDMLMEQYSRYGGHIAEGMVYLLFNMRVALV